MIVIAAEGPVRPEGWEALRATLSRHAETSRAEAGCIDYRFSVDIDDPHLIRLFECWEDQASLDAHLAAPHSAAFGTTIGPSLAGPLELTRYEVSSHGPMDV
ncbi:putative quinol monooxygenase [Euzebya tangerina]|uniref:putative quinol monooxygenase n=1 Tax=Euzebya tangerina TaxID=591198 RepID=UPI000E310CD2|nr:putative quinol monooxygenase [Euzebya tangerina]